MRFSILYFIFISLIGFYPPQALSFGTIIGDEFNSGPKLSYDYQDHLQREIIKTKNAWETLASLPGKIIFSPLILFLNISGEVVAFFDETKIVQKTTDLLISDDGRKGVLPVYSPRRGTGATFFHKNFLVPGAELTVTASGGLLSRQRYGVKLENMRIFSDRIASSYSAQYQLLSDESFFGLGNKTDQRNESNYARELTEFEAVFTFDVSEKITAKLLAGYDINHIFRGRDTDIPSIADIFSSNDIAGIGEKIKMLKFDLGVSFDLRNRPVLTSSGGTYDAGVSYYTETGKDRFGFAKFNIDISQYFNLSYNRIIVLRIASEVTQELSDREIPFYYLGELGRQETIRGFERGRYRDKDFVLGSLEYRYPIYGFVDAVLFADAGKVSDDVLDNISRHGFHAGFGGGFNVWNRNGLALQLLYGKSREESRVYLVFSRGLR